MKLSLSERQTLIGPFVIGSLLGLFVAYGVVALSSEFALHGNASPTAQVVAEAAGGFVISVLVTVAVLGILPIAVRRFRSKEQQ